MNKRSAISFFIGLQWVNGFGTKYETVNKGKSIIDCIGESEQWL